MTPLGRLLARSVDRGVPHRAQELKLRMRWPLIAGAEIASRSRVTLKGNLLVIEVDDEAWAREIRRLTGTLRGRLREQVGSIKTIEVVYRPDLRRTKGGPGVADASAPPAEVAPAPLSDALEQKLAQLADDTLREQMRRTMQRYIAGGRARATDSTPVPRRRR